MVPAESEKHTRQDNTESLAHQVNLAFSQFKKDITYKHPVLTLYE